MASSKSIANEKGLNFLAKHTKKQFPKQIRGLRCIGLEREYPVVSAETGEAADIRKTIFPALLGKGWKPKTDDVYEEEVVELEKDGVLITTDAGYCTLELALPPIDNLFEARGVMEKTERVLVEVAEKSGVLILGYGIQPVTAENANLWMRKRRYETLVQDLKHPGVHKVTISASDQHHVDTTQDEIVRFFNMFNALSFVYTGLFANSPIWLGKRDGQGRLATRESFWREITDEKRWGVPEKRVKSIEELLGLFAGFRLVIARDHRGYYNPRCSFTEWARKTKNPESIISGWKIHEGTIWFDARPRMSFGTTEIRSPCAQIQGGGIYPPALTLGLAENIGEAEALMSPVVWSVWNMLKESSIHGFYFWRNYILQNLIDQVLEISKRGLQARGLGEEIFIDELIEREVPAITSLRHYEAGGIDGLIKSLAIK